MFQKTTSQENESIIITPLRRQSRACSRISSTSGTHALLIEVVQMGLDQEDFMICCGITPILSPFQALSILSCWTTAGVPLHQ